MPSGGHGRGHIEKLMANSNSTLKNTRKSFCLKDLLQLLNFAQLNQGFRTLCAARKEISACFKLQDRHLTYRKLESQNMRSEAELLSHTVTCAISLGNQVKCFQAQRKILNEKGFIISDPSTNEFIFKF